MAAATRTIGLVLFVLLASAHAITAATLNLGDILVGDVGSDQIFIVDPATGVQTALTAPDTGNYSSITAGPPGIYYVVDAGTDMVSALDVATSTLSPIATVSQAFSLTTDLAGDLIVAARGPSGGAVVRVDPATGAQTTLTVGGLLNLPHGIAVEPTGSILVAHQSSPSLIRVNPSTGAQTVVASGAPLQTPTDVVVAPSGDIYVSDANAGTGGAVIRIDPITGVPTILSTGGFFADPSEIALALNGDLLVVDFSSDSLVQIDRTTGVQTLLSSAGNLQIPQGLAVQLPATPGPTISVGDILVGDVGSDQILIIDPTSGVQRALTAPGSGNFTGIAHGPPGTLYVLDAATEVVSRLRFADLSLTNIATVSQGFSLTTSPNGEILVAARGPSSGAVVRIDPATGTQTTLTSGGFLNLPHGIATDSSGSILVAHQSSSSLIRVDPLTGAQSVVASGAPLQAPTGVVVAPSGDIYVSDANAGTGGAVIRIDPITGVPTILSTGGFFADPSEIALALNGDLLVVDFSSDSLIRVNPTTGVQTLVSSGSALSIPQSLVVLGAASGAGCGNGVIDSGEDCDIADPTSTPCCTITCQFAQTGTLCDDGDFCTQVAQCDAAGTCVSGSVPIDCDDQETCTLDSCNTVVGACESTPIAGCSTTTGSMAVVAGAGSTASVSGGSAIFGGVDLQFTDAGGGLATSELVLVPSNQSTAFSASEPEFQEIDFGQPTEPNVFWDLDYNGSFTGPITVTFGYDDALFAPGFDETQLSIYHWVPVTTPCSEGADCGWVDPPVVARDTAANTITVMVDSLSPFALGVDVQGAAIESYWTFAGIALGGSISFTIAGVDLVVSTAASESAEAVASNIAAIINANGTLSAAGIFASASFGAVQTTSPVSNPVVLDTGLFATLGAGPPMVSTTSTLALALLVALTSMIGWRFLRVRVV